MSTSFTLYISFSTFAIKGILHPSLKGRGRGWGLQLFYYRQLQPVEVLHLIHLYPRIALEGRIVFECRISELQEILEVEQVVLVLIGHISMGIAHLHQALLSLVLEGNGEDRLVNQVKVIVSMVIDIYHQCGIKRSVRRFSDGFQGSDILWRDTLRMNPQLLGYSMDDVVHQV